MIGCVTLIYITEFAAKMETQKSHHQGSSSVMARSPLGVGQRHIIAGIACLSLVFLLVGMIPGRGNDSAVHNNDGTLSTKLGIRQPKHDHSFGVVSKRSKGSSGSNGSEIPRKCRKRQPIKGHVDIDQKRDYVYHDWLNHDARLGVCTGSGREDRIRGEAQAELLSLVDVEPDGRDEILYGGTTMRAAISYVAVFRKGRLVRVKTSDDRLVVVDGLDEGFIKNKRPTGAAFGCQDTVGNGEDELVQAIVFPKQQRFRWVKRSYQFKNRMALEVAKKSGSFHNDPDKRNSDEVRHLAQTLIADCETVKE